VSIRATRPRSTPTNGPCWPRWDERALRVDRVVEIDLAIPSLFGLARLVDDRDCAVTFARAITHAGNEPSLLFEIDGLPADAIATAFEDAAVSAHILTERENGALVELRPVDRTLFDALDEHSATLDDCIVAPDEVRLRLQTSRESLARSLVARLRESFASVTVRSVTTTEEPTTTRRSFVADLTDDLTDRQLTALTKAHASGYFEWPHEVSGDDLADSMGVARPTFHQHLRAAERKLVAAVLDAMGDT
jgi:predicted DNA binding protein